MANEAVLIHETELPIPMTVADGTGIERGTLLKLTDPNTAIINSGSNDAVAGVAGSEKIANDGRTKIDVYRGGVFSMKISGSVTVGDSLITAVNANIVKTAPSSAGVSGHNVVGTALETGTEAETILVELKPITIKHA